MSNASKARSYFAGATMLFAANTAVAEPQAIASAIPSAAPSERACLYQGIYKAGLTVMTGSIGRISPDESEKTFRITRDYLWRATAEQVQTNGNKELAEKIYGMNDLTQFADREVADLRIARKQLSMCP